MPITTQIIEGPYLRDILNQPQALRHALGGLAGNAGLAGLPGKLASGAFCRVALTGMGSSLHALYPLHLALSRRGIASFWVETAELLIGFDSLYRSDTLLVAVSQSGESAEIVRLMDRRGEFGHVIGVTNDPHSCLGRQAGSTLLLRAGVEAAVSCKTYVTTLAVLHWLGGILCQADMARVLDELEVAQAGLSSYLPCWRGHVGELVTLTRNIQSTFITGRGESLATAGTAGLTLKESTHRHAEGMSCAAFRHGPLEMAGEHVFVLVFEGDQRVASLNRRLYEDVIRSGGRAAWAAARETSAPVFRLPAVVATLRPIVEILPVQMLSLALAAHDGREAGRFERASKVTVTE